MKTEKLYQLTAKGEKLLKQLKCNKRVNMVELAASSLLINHENTSSHSSSNDEEGKKEWQVKQQ
jgi:DNA-binding PadR family transcriptional regulator